MKIRVKNSKDGVIVEVDGEDGTILQYISPKADTLPNIDAATKKMLPLERVKEKSRLESELDGLGKAT